MIDGNVTGKSIKGKITSIPKVDATLSKEGQCAEAKATGEALNNKVNLRDIADNLTTADASKVLSAKQGVELKKLIDEETQNRKNAISTLQDETNEIINGVNDAIAAANDDIDDLGNNLTAAEQNIAKNEQAIAEIDGAGKVGTYIGNGSAVTRKIETGITGKAVMIYSTNYIAFVTENGGVGFSTVSGLNPFVLNSNAATFTNGEITIKTDNALVNADGYEYTYIAL